MYLSKSELIAIILIILITLGYKAFYAEEETFEIEPVYIPESSELDEAFEEAWEAQGGKYLDESSFIDPFAPDTWLDSPLGLTIDPKECVDTYLRTDVSCADKEAILKFRNTLQDAEVKRLKLEVERLERDVMYEEFGLREC